MQIQGYYSHKEFYQPNYDQVTDSMSDFRNTLAWFPNLQTDSMGNAVVEFFCSDINSLFIGVIEGVSSNGLLGRKEFTFRVVP